MPIRIITTVITPASSYDLTDVDTAKDELGTSATDQDNGRIQRFITQESKAVAKYCGCQFVVETVTDNFVSTDPSWSGGGYPSAGGCYFGRDNQQTNVLNLSRKPIVSVASVSENTSSLVSGTDYLIDNEGGALLRLSAGADQGTHWGGPPLSVTYSAGFTTIPEDLVEIVLRLVTLRYSQRGRDPSIIERDQPGLGTTRYWVGGAGQDGPFPPDICAYLDRTYGPVGIG